MVNVQFVEPDSKKLVKRIVVRGKQDQREEPEKKTE